MAAVDVGTLDSLKEKGRLLVQVENHFVALFEIDGKIFAIEELCSHRAGPLSEGRCEGQTVICPWHGSRFDLASGEVIQGPARRKLRTYTVQQANGRLLVSFNS